MTKPADDNSGAPPEQTNRPGGDAKGARHTDSNATIAQAETPSLSQQDSDGGSKRQPFMLLGLGALGIVFGDIGTSPLYALHACFHSKIGVAPTTENVFGVLSMVFWALAIVVVLKYLIIIMRADYRGEGGIFALLANIRTNKAYRGNSRKAVIVTIMAIFGAALMYGDGVITPSISVLSSVAGLQVASDDMTHLIIPIAVIILWALFLGQRFGVERLSFVFGPIMLVWFGSIATFGILSICEAPQILEAINPWYAISFWMDFPWRAFVILGAVVLAVTGGEALFADMGQFSRRSIALAWYCVVWPALIANYFGQGAHLLGQETAAVNPFFAIVPRSLLYPMVVVATLAAIIASQALISGAFTLTRQAIQLGLLPECRIVHTSRKSENQVFIPGVNRALFILCILTVLGFQNATNLSAAYGVAVTALMVATTILFSVLAWKVWEWSLWYLIPLLVFFIIIDLAFFTSNLLKVPHGGWFPLVLAGVLIVQMTTWRRGRLIVDNKASKEQMSLTDFIAMVSKEKPPRSPGTGVYLMAMRSAFELGGEQYDEDVDITPPVLAALYKQLSVLQEQVIVLIVEPRPVPFVSRKNRMRIQQLDEGFWWVRGRYGFSETHNVPKLLRWARAKGLNIDLSQATYFTIRNSVVPTKGGLMVYWRAVLFAMMSRNATSRARYYELPADRIFEVGRLSNL